MGNVDYTGYLNIDWSKIYSLTEILGQPLPVHPNVRDSKIGIYFLMRGKFKEGTSFCTQCLTSTPSIPKTHHEDCSNYRNEDEYPEHDSPLGLCRDCGSEFLELSSCREMELSWISCKDCGYCYQDSLCEEDLVKEYLGEK